MKANALRIRVSESERTKVDLTFRAAVAENLADIIPEELAPKLVQRGIDVGEIARGAVRDEFAPGELFVLDESEKRIRVWLE